MRISWTRWHASTSNDAGKALAYVGDETSRGSDQLTRHLSGLAGMAGTDSAGTQWAAAYDEGAAIVITAAAVIRDHQLRFG